MQAEGMVFLIAREFVLESGSIKENSEVLTVAGPDNNLTLLSDI
jgi:hypothetical protein